MSNDNQNNSRRDHFDRDEDWDRNRGRTIKGTNGNDIITGTSGNDNIAGSRGDDLIHGGAGKDKVSGGEGNDTIYGDAGDDALDGGKGNDVLLGGTGNDDLDGGDGNDQLYGDSGNDKLKGGKGEDAIFGGTGNDDLDGGQGNDVLDGEDGNDDLKGGSGADALYGAAGNDELEGGEGDDALAGGSGNDDLKGNEGSDTLDGGAGNDEVDGDSGNDALVYNMSENTGAHDDYDGGSGSDTLRLELTRAEWMRADVQADVARFVAYLSSQSRSDGRGDGHDDRHDVNDDDHGHDRENRSEKWFEFRAFDLDVRRIEKFEIRVDGVAQDPRDQGVDALNDAGSATEDGSVGGNVLANDSVPDLLRTVELVAGPAQGTLVFNPDGSYVYTPGAYFNSLAEGQTATQSFSYRITDADGDVDTATVTITITGSNDGPVVTNGTAALVGAVQEDSSPFVSGQLSASDVDHGATQTWSVQSYATGTYGSLAVDQAGKWTYTLDNVAHQDLAQDESHEETFTVRVADDQGEYVDQTVVVAVSGTNDTASISGTVSGTVGEDGSLQANGQLNTTDADHDQGHLHAQSNVAGAYGSFSVDANGAWAYALDNGAAAVQALNTGESVTDAFTVLSQDGSASQEVTVTINGLNDITAGAPVATDDTINLNSGEGQITFGSWDFYTYTSYYDTNGNYVYQYDLGDVTQTQYYDNNSGRYVNTVTTDDGFLFTGGAIPQGNYSDGPWTSGYWGVDYSNVLYSYGTGNFYEYNGGVAVEARPIEMTRIDGGTFSIDSVNITSLSNGYSYSSGYSISHYEGQGDVLETVTGYLDGVQVAQQSFHVPDANNGTRFNVVDLTAPGFNSVDQLEFRLSANFSDPYYDYYVSADAYQWIDNINPVSGSSNVLANDTDADPLAILTINGYDHTSAMGAAVSLSSNGDLSYDSSMSAAVKALAAGESAVDTFTYSVRDQNGQVSNTATVSVNVHGVNDAATISGASTGTVTEDDAPQATGQLIVSDPDHDQSFVQAISNQGGNYGTFNLTADGNWTYDLYNDNSNIQSLAQGEHLSDSFTVYSQDGTAQQQVAIDIVGMNDAPVANADAKSGAVLTFEYGAYNSSYQYDYNTGQYHYTIVANDDYQFTDNGGGNYQGSYVYGPEVWGGWGADYSNALVSYGYKYYWETDPNTVNSMPIEMTRVDGGVFSVDTANITSYNNSYYYDSGATFYETVTGFRNGAQVAQQSFFVPAFNSTGTYNHVVDLTDPGFNAVDRIEFRLTANYGSNGYYDYAYQALDNIVLPASISQASDIRVLLNDTDIDNGAQLSVASFDLVSVRGAAISLNADGSLRYDPTVSAEIQALSRGESVTDTFTYVTRDGQGGLSSPATVTVNMMVGNHAAFITGDVTGATIEDGTQQTYGQLAVTDSDAGEAGFTVQTSAAATYGSFSIDAAGAWSYTLDNAAAEVQALAQGATVTDSFTVTSLDGTAKVVAVTVTGSNDAPSVSVAAGLPVTTGLALWLDASDLDGNSATDNPSAGSAVALWEDKSGNNHDVAQNYASYYQPTLQSGPNGAAVVHFDGGDYLQTLSQMQLFADSTAPLTVFAVFNTGTIYSQEFLLNFGLGSSQNRNFELGVAGGGVSGTWGVHGGSSQETAMTGISANTWTVAETMLGDGTGFSFWKDGYSASPTYLGSGWPGTYDRPTVANYLEIGGRRDGNWTSPNDPGAGVGSNWQGDMAEIIVFQSELSAADRQSVEDYLSSKYQLAVRGAVQSGGSVGNDSTLVEAGILEDGTAVPGVSSAGGTLRASDVDSGAGASWSGNARGTYGNFSIDQSSGEWSYLLDNGDSDTQLLLQGQNVTESFTATATDEFGAAATHIVSLNITGTRDAVVSGSSGDDVLAGTNGDDVLFGDSGNDQMSGGNGADLFIGGTGDDVLTGGSGADRFVIGQGHDTITDFATGAQGDSLDIKDLLVGYNPATSSLADFVQLGNSGADTTVSVDVDGASNGSSYSAFVTLQGVTDMLLDQLQLNGNLVVW